MNYDVVEMRYEYPRDGQRPVIWIIYTIVNAEDGEPIGLTLPPKCESVEMGKEWLSGFDESIDLDGFAADGIAEMFTDFLKLRKQEPAAETQEATGENEYRIVKPAIAGFAEGKKYFLQHINSKAMVSIPLPSREDAAGFLKWWIQSGKEHLTEGAKMLHWKSLGQLEQLFKRYKAEQEPEYVCPECGGSYIVVDVHETQRSLRQMLCGDCEAKSGRYHCKEQPHKSWIR